MLPINRLISHRFRGFAKEENTVQGLLACFDFGVKYVEFDIRVARCGTPMIYHDEYALDASGHMRNICDVMATDFTQVGGRFKTIPTAEELFNAAAAHPDKTAVLLVDIKDAGFEMEIHSLVMAAGLSERVNYVSWVPEVLYQINAIAPNTPLCLSHWCQNPGSLVRSHHTVYDAKNGCIPRPESHVRKHGERSGWYVENGLKGELRELLRSVKGSVCLPQAMASAELIAAYHTDGIEVSTFSYIEWPSIMAHEDTLKPDFYFIDKKGVFDAL